MILELKKRIEESDVRIPIAYALDLSQLQWRGERPFASSVQIKGELCLRGGFAELDFTASFDFSTSCDRCAAPVNQHYCYRFTHTLVEALSNAADADDGRYVVLADGALDMDSLAQEDILLELPSKFLCREDCKGLCPQCGKNLNEGPCGCDRRQLDPRLEALKQFLE